MNKFWDFKKVSNTADNEDITENILILNGPIAEESWWGDQPCLSVPCVYGRAVKGDCGACADLR